jgi:hypothetical protein
LVQYPLTEHVGALQATPLHFITINAQPHSRHNTNPRYQCRGDLHGRPECTGCPGRTKGDREGRPYGCGGGCRTGGDRCTKCDREGRPYGWRCGGGGYAFNPVASTSMPSPTCRIMPTPYFLASSKTALSMEKPAMPR